MKSLNTLKTLSPRGRRPGEAALVCVLLLASAAAAARGETIEWTRQVGTSLLDRSLGVSADGLGNSDEMAHSPAVGELTSRAQASSTLFLDPLVAGASAAAHGLRAADDGG